jgi:hypothetical protein
VNEVLSEEEINQLLAAISDVPTSEDLDYALGVPDLGPTKEEIDNLLKIINETEPVKTQPTYSVIADEEELRFWWDYGMPPLSQDGIYFVSRSARNKKLSEEEREYYHCGRSEMFDKKQIRHDSWESFLKHIKRFEVRKDAFLTKNGKPYPEKCLVTYINISEISAYKAMKDQMSYLSETLIALSDSCLKKSKSGIDDSFYKIKKSFDTCQSLFARNFGKKFWIDIDVDCDNLVNEDIENILQIFYRNGWVRGEVMLIRTGGGVHCLIKADKLKQDPAILCGHIESELKNIHQEKDIHEVVVNKNFMIPCPGLYQYQEPVFIINKDDFIGVVEPFHHAEDIC